MKKNEKISNLHLILLLIYLASLGTLAYLFTKELYRLFMRG